MNKDIFNYLNQYFEYKVNSTATEIARINKFYKNLDNLFDKKKLTLEEKDLIVEDMSSLIDYVIKKLSECPYLEIHIRKVIKNTITKVVEKKQPSIEAIGFHIDDDSDFADLD